jgi:beta-glucosidase
MTSPLQDDLIRQKVENLMSKMNLDQKIGQMTQVERSYATPDDVRQYHLGSVLSGSGHE